MDTDDKSGRRTRRTRTNLLIMIQVMMVLGALGTSPASAYDASFSPVPPEEYVPSLTAPMGFGGIAIPNIPLPIPDKIEILGITIVINEEEEEEEDPPEEDPEPTKTYKCTAQVWESCKIECPNDGHVYNLWVRAYKMNGSGGIETRAGASGCLGNSMRVIDWTDDSTGEYDVSGTYGAGSITCTVSGVSGGGNGYGSCEIVIN